MEVYRFRKAQIGSGVIQASNEMQMLSGGEKLLMVMTKNVNRLLIA